MSQPVSSLLWQLHHSWLVLEQAQLELQMTSAALRSGEVSPEAAEQAMKATLNGLLEPVDPEEIIAVHEQRQSAEARAGEAAQ